MLRALWTDLCERRFLRNYPSNIKVKKKLQHKQYVNSNIVCSLLTGDSNRKSFNKYPCSENILIQTKNKYPIKKRDNNMIKREIPKHFSIFSFVTPFCITHL